MAEEPKTEAVPASTAESEAQVPKSDDTKQNGALAIESAVPKEQSATDATVTNGDSEVMAQKSEPIGTDDKAGATEEEVTTGPKPTDDADPDPAANPAVPVTPSSAKGKARRKSSGVPEHKQKKSAKKGGKTTVYHTDAKPGDYFFIRLKGYPLWPGVVASDDMLSKRMLDTRPVTAAKPDGTYNENYSENGKRINDRTFPVMYLATQEFSWIPNFDLLEMDLDNLKPDTKSRNKDLAHAFELAGEKHDLQHWKDVLLQFEADRTAEREAKAARAAEKAAAKTAGKGKRKSKAAVDEEDADADGDVDMADAPGEEEDADEKKPKSSKKRKATTEAEESLDTPTRTDSVKKLKLKLNSSAPKTPNGNATPKSTTKKDQSATKSGKSKTKKSAANGAAAESAPEPKEPELSPEEKLQKKEKEIMFLRHKLQKGLLTRDAQPKEEEMKQMSDYITKLEEHANLEVSIMRNTKINKVLKAILKLEEIPKEDEFKFKDRSQKLLNEWNKILGTEPTADSSTSKETTNGVSSTKTEEKAETDVNGDEKPVNNESATAASTTATETTKIESDAQNVADTSEETKPATTAQAVESTA